MVLDDVCWMSYEEHREIQEFQKIFRYSGWMMCGVEKVYRHLPERVKRQYRYVQNIPRPPTYVLSMQASHIPQALSTFVLPPLRKKVWFSRQEIYMAVRGWIYVMVRTGVSPSNFATYFRISSEASKWGPNHFTLAAAPGERLAWYLWYG